MLRKLINRRMTMQRNTSPKMWARRNKKIARINNIIRCFNQFSNSNITQINR